MRRRVLAGILAVPLLSAAVTATVLVSKNHVSKHDDSKSAAATPNVDSSATPLRFRVPTGDPPRLTCANARQVVAQMRETLRTMSARIVEDACIDLPLMGRGLDAAGIASDDTFSAAIRQALCAFAQAIAQAKTQA